LVFKFAFTDQLISPISLLLTHEIASLILICFILDGVTVSEDGSLLAFLIMTVSFASEFFFHRDGVARFSGRFGAFLRTLGGRRGAVFGLAVVLALGLGGGLVIAVGEIVGSGISVLGVIAVGFGSAGLDGGDLALRWCFGLRSWGGFVVGGSIGLGFGFGLGCTLLWGGFGLGRSAVLA